MQTFNSAIAAVRFGTGIAPGQALAGSRRALMAQLRTNDPAGSYPRADLRQRTKLLQDQAAARKATRRQAPNAQALEQDVTARYRSIIYQDNLRLIGRSVDSQAGFFERLAWFWTDHFTVSADGRRRSLLAYDFVETAVRPHIAGRFANMLKAGVRPSRNAAPT